MLTCSGGSGTENWLRMGARACAVLRAWAHARQFPRGGETADRDTFLDALAQLTPGNKLALLPLAIGWVAECQDCPVTAVTIGMALRS